MHCQGDMPEEGDAISRGGNLWLNLSMAELIYGVPAPSPGEDPSSELSGWTMTFSIAFVAIPLGAVPNITYLPSVPT
jgi:hypothetical protein